MQVRICIFSAPSFCSKVTSDELLVIAPKYVDLNVQKQKVAPLNFALELNFNLLLGEE
jgi:hypothetical protein